MDAENPIYEDPTMNMDGVCIKRVRQEIDQNAALDILDTFERSMRKGYTLVQTYRFIARAQGRDPKTIEAFIRRMRSTTSLAQMKVKARAAELMDKVMDKAAPGELIDILSRPNIGVLEPMRKTEGSTGFILNVSAESCGAVKIGILHNSQGAAPHGIQANAPAILED